MDTTEVMKLAMQALRDSGVPKDLWPTALPLAIADLRRGEGPAVHATQTAPANPSPPTPAKVNAKKKNSGRPAAPAAAAGPAVLSSLPGEDEFLKRLEKETGVSIADLADIFHIDNGKLDFKVASKDLGPGPKPGTQTIAALLGGAVFAGTDHRKLPFSEINTKAKERNLYNPGNSATFIKTTPGFAAVGTGPGLSLTTKNGWQAAFVTAAKRVLKKS
jgi:hypothetical protein